MSRASVGMGSSIASTVPVLLPLPLKGRTEQTRPSESRSAPSFELYHYGLVHGSKPNDSDDRRIGFAITFVSADTMPRGRRDTGMLVRGRAINDGWELEPRPKTDLDAGARAAHKRAMAIRSGYFFSEAGKERVVAEAVQ